jgi:hypothetical protein
MNYGPCHRFSVRHHQPPEPPLFPCGSVGRFLVDGWSLHDRREDEKVRQQGRLT